MATGTIVLFLNRYILQMVLTKAAFQLDECFGKKHVKRVKFD